MNAKLSEEDRQAVDLLLDRQRAVAPGGNGMDVEGMTRGFSPHVVPVNQDRVIAVSELLGLLDLMPSEEPPPGLVDRTIARIEGSIAAPEHEPFRPAAVDTSTHA